MRSLLRRLSGADARAAAAAAAAEAARAAGYALQVATVYRTLFVGQRVPIAGQSILEISPGPDLGAQILMADWGARVTVAALSLPQWDETRHAAIYGRLRELVGASPSLDRVIAQRSYEGVIECVEASAEDLACFDSGRFDVVLSNAVLEHVRDIEACIRETTRITKPTGVQSHQIDFRDHRDFSRPLEFLLEADSWTPERAHDHGHPRRPYELDAICERAGLRPERLWITESARPEYLADFIPRLRASDSPYRATKEDDLSPLGVRYWLAA